MLQHWQCTFGRIGSYEDDILSQLQNFLLNQRAEAACSQRLNTMCKETSQVASQTCTRECCKKLSVPCLCTQSRASVMLKGAQDGTNASSRGLGKGTSPKVQSTHILSAPLSAEQELSESFPCTEESAGAW